jgi:hypothetical protein
MIWISIVSLLFPKGFLYILFFGYNIKLGICVYKKQELIKKDIAISKSLFPFCFGVDKTFSMDSS